MAKMPVTIVAQSNVETEESHLVKSPEASKEVAAEKSTGKTKRNFEVSDSHALYAVYPQFFKLVPDYAKIRQAIRLGLDLPGLSFFTDKGEPEIDESVIEDNSGQPLQRL